MASLLTSTELASIATDAVNLRDTYSTSVTFSNMLPLEQQTDYHAQMGWKEGATKLTTNFTLNCIVVPMAQAKMRGLFAAKRRIESPGGDVPVGDLLVEVVAAELGANTVTDTTFLTVHDLTYRVSSVETVGSLLYCYAVKTNAQEDLETVPEPTP